MNKLTQLETVEGVEVYVNVDFVITVAQLTDSEGLPVLGQVALSIAAGAGGERVVIGIKGTVKEVVDLINTGG